MANQRYDYLDNSIAHAGDLLDRSVEAGLVSLEESAILDTVLDSYCVPNVRHGKVTIPKAFRDSDVVPLVALAPGEELEYGQLPQLSSQRRQSAAFYAMLEIQGVNPDAVANVNSALIAERTGKLAMDAVLGGVTVKTTLDINLPTQAFGNHQGDVLRVVGRPIVALQYFKDLPRHPQPGTLLHESKHVEQYMERGLDFAPIDAEAERDELLRDELAAYNLGHRVLQAAFSDSGMPEAIHQYESMTMEVEYVRSQYNSEHDPFEVTPELLEKLQERNLLQSMLGDIRQL